MHSDIDIGEHLQRHHFACVKLHMRFCVIAGCKIDFHCTFVVQSDFTLMIVKTPIRQWCHGNDRLIQKAAPKAELGAPVSNGLTQRPFSLCSAQFRRGFSGQDTSKSRFRAAHRAVSDKCLPKLRVRRIPKSKLLFHTAREAFTFIMANKHSPGIPINILRSG